VRLLKKILKLSQNELAELIIRIAQENNFNIIDKSPYYIIVNYTEKEIPALNAHLDIIGDEIPKKLIEDCNIIKTNGILGGDDRCGVYIMLELIQRKIKDYMYIFFFDEEIGCIGSNKFNEKINPTCFVGLDRCGFNDIALYGYDNDELTKTFTNIGYEIKQGSITDVAVLAQKYGIACVNLSVGFFNEHTTSEFINLKAVEFTLDTVLNKNIIHKITTHKFKVDCFLTYSPYYDYYYDEYNNYDNSLICDWCGKETIDLYDCDQWLLCEHCYYIYLEFNK